MWFRKPVLLPGKVDLLVDRSGPVVVAGLRSTRKPEVEHLVLTRDDLAVEYVGLLVATGAAARAREILVGRRFHPWEGGEGRVVAAWDATAAALGVDPGDPPTSLGEARPLHPAPAAVGADGATDYFATSLPDLLLFAREDGDGW